MIEPGQSKDTDMSMRICLDLATVRALLNRFVDWPADAHVETVRIARFMPRRDSRFDVEYDLSLRSGDGGTQTNTKVFGRVPRLAEASVSGARPRLCDNGVAGVFVQFDDPDLTIHSMDRDPALAHLSDCMAAGGDPKRLGGFEAPWYDPSLSWRCAPISFRAGRRFVVRYYPSADDGKCPGFVGKGFADERGQTICERQEQLSYHLQATTHSDIRVPRVLHYESERRLMLSEWSNGRAGGDGVPAELRVAYAARALAALHAACLDGLNRTGAAEQVEVLHRWHHVIRVARPDLAAQAGDLLGALDSASRDGDGAETVIHGDFYESQVLVGADAVTILDLDTLAVGNPSIDIGNFLAHEWLWCLQNGCGLNRYASIVHATLQAYESIMGSVDERSLSFFWAVSLYRIGAIHAFRSTSALYAGSVWDLIMPVLQRGRAGVHALLTMSQDVVRRGGQSGGVRSVEIGEGV